VPHAYRNRAELKKTGVQNVNAKTVAEMRSHLLDSILMKYQEKKKGINEYTQDRYI
jgi:hypothetical protein